MFKQNLLVFWRNILKEKVQFFLTITGLVMGLIAVLLAFTIIQDDYQFDDFHEQSDRIFRVNKHVKENNGDITKNAETPGLMAPTLDAEMPEVELATRIAPWFDRILVSYEDQNTFVKNWMFVDSNFFRVFDFEMIKGDDPAKILSTPGQVIITPELAQTLFGQFDPIGRTIKGQSDKNYTVAGLVKPAPRQSHIQYDALVSWASTEKESDFLNFNFMNNWLGQTVYTYVLLRQPEQQAAVDDKFAAFTARHMENRKDTYDFFLQPLDEIYLNSTDLLYLRGMKLGSASFIRTFSIISFFLLLIACFNYINITTAKSLQRAKEVGVKKVLGAKKNQLISQFMTETVTLTVVASLLAIGFAQLFLQQLNLWFEKDIPAISLISADKIFFLSAIIIITSLVAGFFPSWMLTKYRPVSVLKNSKAQAPGGEWPRQILTTLQLTMSIGLIAGMLILQQQFNFISNKNLGFDKDQVLTMSTPPGVNENLEAFRNELTSLPGIQSVSICNASVQQGTFGTGVIPEGKSEEMMVQLYRVDSNYLETFGMELAEGRFLNLASDFDPGTMIVNEAFVKQAGWTNPLERSLRFEGGEEKYPVVGVLKDFNFNSLHQEVSPLVMYLDNRTTHTSVRFDPAKLSSLLPQIQSLWERFETRFPFDYQFLDEYFAEKYLAEQQMLKVISLFAFLAILIACLGMYGLASFAIARRRKEIGIRKVLGASVTSIVGLLSSRFVKLVGIALLLATPIVYYYGNNWLNNFAYHINMNGWVFLIAGIIVLGIVFFTVSFQSIRAALANPVKSLRSE